MVSQDLSAELAGLFMKHGPAVFRRCLRLLGNRADAEEATQEVFIRAMRGKEGYEGRSQATTWLYRITTNYCLNLLRDQRRRRELLSEHGGGDPQGSPASPSDLLLLRRLLCQANEEQARAAIYVHIDGMSHEEVAELLGVSRRSVGNLLSRFQEWASAQLAGPSERSQP